MNRVSRIIGLVVVVAVVFSAIQTLGLAQDDKEKKAKHTIKQVMKTAHKDGLLKKVTGGSASDADKKQLLDLYISLVENTPPKGEMDSWHVRAGNVTLAAAKVVVGREGAVAELKKATTCAACHKVHKPK